MTIYTLGSVEGKYARAVAWLGLSVLVFGLFVGPVLAGDAPSGAAIRIAVGTFLASSSSPGPSTPWSSPVRSRS
jgi:hypothetical protein